MTKILTAAACVLAMVATACGSSSSAAGASGATEARGGGLVGQAAPDFSLKRENGDGQVELASLKGKVVVVDFWATWCKPCVKSFPKYQELYVKYKGQVEIIGVSKDTENDEIASFGKTHGVEFPLVWDADNGLAQKWEPKKMPTAFVIDKEGVVRSVHYGYEDGDEAQLEREIKELL